LAIDPDRHHLDPNLDQRVDWIGAALITSGLVLFTFAIGDGETAVRGWRTGCEHTVSFFQSRGRFQIADPYTDIIATLILSLVLIAVFIYWEYVLDQEAALPSGQSRRARPLVSLKLFARANGRLAVMQTMAFFVWAGFCSWMFYAQAGSPLFLSPSPNADVICMTE
jgi:hypothetical protein